MQSLIDEQVLQNSRPEAKTPTRPSSKLAVQVINPPYRFNIADFAQINLGC
jgi:hypothetical protein